MFILYDIKGDNNFLNFYLNYTGHEIITRIAIIGTMLKEKAITTHSQIFPIALTWTVVSIVVSSDMI